MKLQIHTVRDIISELAEVHGVEAVLEAIGAYAEDTADIFRDEVTFERAGEQVRKYEKLAQAIDQLRFNEFHRAGKQGGILSVIDLENLRKVHQGA